MSRKMLAAIGLSLFVALSGCGDAAEPTQEEESSGGFYVRLEEGADCPELFEIRNELDPKDPDIPDMNEALREIGCYSSTSERTD